MKHEVPFSLKRLETAQEFAVEQLGNNCISVHIISEWIFTNECIKHIAPASSFPPVRFWDTERQAQTFSEKTFPAKDFQILDQSRLLFDLLRRKVKCYPNIWINCLKGLMGLNPEQRNVPRKVLSPLCRWIPCPPEGNCFFGWRFSRLDKGSVWKGCWDGMAVLKLVKRKWEYDNITNSLMW